MLIDDLYTAQIFAWKLKLGHFPKINDLYTTIEEEKNGRNIDCILIQDSMNTYFVIVLFLG